MDSAETRAVCNEALRWAKRVKAVGDRSWCRMVEWLEFNSHTPMSTEHLDVAEEGR